MEPISSSPSMNPQPSPPWGFYPRYPTYAPPRKMSQESSPRSETDNHSGQFGRSPQAGAKSMDDYEHQSTRSSPVRGSSCEGSQSQASTGEVLEDDVTNKPAMKHQDRAGSTTSPIRTPRKRVIEEQPVKESSSHNGIRGKMTYERDDSFMAPSRKQQARDAAMSDDYTLKEEPGLIAQKQARKSSYNEGSDEHARLVNEIQRSKRTLDRLEKLSQDRKDKLEKLKRIEEDAEALKKIYEAKKAIYDLTIKTIAFNGEIQQDSKKLVGGRSIRDAMAISALVADIKR